MGKKAQSMLEYAILAGIIAAALFAMQAYFQRGIQGVVKLAADEMGDQKKGAGEYNPKIEWSKAKPRGSTVTSATDAAKTTTLTTGGGVSYDISETTSQSGVLADDIYREKK